MFFVLIADEDLFEFNFFARTFQKFVETSKANHILKSKRAEMQTYWIAKLTNWNSLPLTAVILHWCMAGSANE